MTVIDYKGYKIEVCPVGKGGRASIFSPGSTTPWPNSPFNLEKVARRRLLPKPSALSRCASVHDSYKSSPGRESNTAWELTDSASQRSRTALQNGLDALTNVSISTVN